MQKNLIINTLKSLKSLKKLSNQQILAYKFTSQAQQNTVDNKEMNHFQNVNDWWNPTGEMRALFEYNITRVEFMKRTIKEQNFLDAENNLEFQYKPLKDFKILDVGCGGGLLSESLARLGANVKGLDACENSINIAKTHRKLDEDRLQNLQYELCTVENLLEKEGENQYDMITSMEVIEHVIDKGTFLGSISKLVKPNGLVFLSTMAKSTQSYLELIVGAEYLLNIVAKGTHDWNKFIDADKLSLIMQQNGVKTLNLQGVNYDFLNNQMNLSNSLNTTYMYAGIKQE